MRKSHASKNILDLEFRQSLSKYSTILNARWAAPLTVAGLFLSRVTDIAAGVFWSLMVAFIVYNYVDNFRERCETELNDIKSQIRSLS